MLATTQCKIVFITLSHLTASCGCARGKGTATVLEAAPPQTIAVSSNGKADVSLTPWCTIAYLQHDLFNGRFRWSAQDEILSVQWSSSAGEGWEIRRKYTALEIQAGAFGNNYPVASQPVDTEMPPVGLWPKAMDTIASKVTPNFDFSTDVTVSFDGQCCQDIPVPTSCASDWRAKIERQTGISRIRYFSGETQEEVWDGIPQCCFQNLNIQGEVTEQVARESYRLQRRDPRLKEDGRCIWEKDKMITALEHAWFCVQSYFHPEEEVDQCQSVPVPTPCASDWKVVKYPETGRIKYSSAEADEELWDGIPPCCFQNLNLVGEVTEEAARESYHLQRHDPRLKEDGTCIWEKDKMMTSLRFAWYCVRNYFHPDTTEADSQNAQPEAAAPMGAQKHCQRVPAPHCATDWQAVKEPTSGRTLYYSSETKEVWDRVPKCCYQNLLFEGDVTGVTKAQAKRNYYKHIRNFHPDKEAIQGGFNCSRENEVMTRALNSAWECMQLAP